MTRLLEEYEAEVLRCTKAAAACRRRIEVAGDAAAKNLSQEIRSDSADVRRRVQELLNTVNGWRRTLGLPLLARPEERPPVHYRQRDLQHRDACNQLADLDAVREAASELAGAAIQAEQDHRRLVEALTQAREAAAAALWDVERERRAVADRRRLLVAAGDRRPVLRRGHRRRRDRWRR